MHSGAWLITMHDVTGAASDSKMAPVLPGAAPLPPPETTEDERSRAMVAGIAQWLAALQPGPAQRRELFDSFPGDRLGNSQGLRNQLREMLGVVASERAQTPHIMATVDALAGPEIVGRTAAFTATAVRWPALTIGGVILHGEGLFLRQRAGPASARVIVLPDADHSPELVSGCLEGSNPEDHYALRLAEAGYDVLVMSLIDRDDAFSGSDAAQATVGGATEATFAATSVHTQSAITCDVWVYFDRLVVETCDSYTNQPHREWLHRPAFLMGRTVIGCEVQKVLAAVEVIIVMPVMLSVRLIVRRKRAIHPPFLLENSAIFGKPGPLNHGPSHPSAALNRSVRTWRGRARGHARRGARASDLRHYPVWLLPRASAALCHGTALPERPKLPNQIRRCR